MEGRQDTNVVHFGVEHKLVKDLLAPRVREGRGGFEGGVQRKRLQRPTLAT